MTRILMVVVFGVALLSGCNKAGSGGGNLSITAAPASVSSGPPVTEAEAKEFSKALQEAVESQNLPAADALIPMNDIVERCMSDLNPPASFLKGFREGMAQRQQTLASQLTKAIASGGSYRLLTIKTVDNSPRPIFRMLNPNDGFNYHEFTLTRTTNGKVVAADIFVALSGEPLTQTMRRIIIPILNESKQGIVDRITGSEKLYFNNMKLIESIAVAMRTGENLRSALTQYRSLPLELQKMKLIQIMALQIAMKVNEQEYEIELERFEKNHPNDPSIDFILLDHFILKGRYPEFYEAIDRIRKNVTDDPYLAVMKANVLIKEKKYKEAATELDEVIKKEPTLDDSYWSYIQLSIEQEQFDATLKWFQTLVETCHLELDFPSIEKEATYSKFVKSKAYPELKSWYQKRPKAKE